MIRKRMQIIFLICIFVLFPPLPLHGQAQIVLTISGGAWNISIGPANIVGGAGNDFTAPVESASDMIDIAITNTAGSGKWRVDIQRTDSAWNANFLLYARRTADGTAGSGSQPSISGGDSYIEITTVAQEFFRGRRTRSGIKVQMELDGFSINNVAPTTYSTTVTYTAIDGW